MSYVGGSRSLLAMSAPDELLDAGLAVFRAALLPENHLIGPFVLAVVVGLAGLLLRQGVPHTASGDDARTVDP
jgi:hypothetical protein